MQPGHIAGGIGAAVEVQLVFQLYGHHAAPVGELALGNDGQHLFQPAAQCLQIGLVILTQHRARLVQPAGQRTAVPLGADVGTGPGDDVQPVPGRQRQKGGHVMLVFEVPFAGAQLMEVPGNIDVDAVVARHAELIHALLPVLPGNAEIKQRRAQQGRRLAVQLKLVFP